VAFLCVGGPTTDVPDSAPWGYGQVPVVGDEMAYAERTTNYTPAGPAGSPDAATMLAAPPITVDGVTPVIVEFYSTFGRAPASNTGVAVNLFDGVTGLGQIAQVYSASGMQDAPIRVARRLTPSAGTHTFSVRGQAIGATGGIIHGGDGSSAANSPMFIRVSRCLPVPPAVTAGTPTNVTYGTSLPASPADGQEAILVDSLTAPTYAWRFRYVASIVSANKWLFIGGDPVIVTVETAQNVQSLTYIDLATVGPQFTIPRAGEYLVGFGAEITSNNANANQMWVTLKNGAAATADADGIYVSSVGNAMQTTIYAFREKQVTFAAAAVAKLQYRQNQTAAAFNAAKRVLRITPKAVA
jgi:hypothetical protein